MSRDDAAIVREAQQLRDSLVECPDVRRVEIAGSIRRQAPRPGDIEIVVEADWERDLVGDCSEHGIDRNWVEPVAIAQRGYRRIKGGGRTARYVQLQAEHTVDLFIAAPDNFGLILAIRTGPREFSAALATRANRIGMHMHNGRLCSGYRRGHAAITGRGDCGGYCPLPTPEEYDVFKALRICWISPAERTAGRAVEPSGEPVP